jgi:hypothetical protein
MSPRYPYSSTPSECPIGDLNSSPKIRCLICYQEGGSHPGSWHLPSCKMYKEPRVNLEADYFWDNLEKDIRKQVRGR